MTIPEVWRAVASKELVARPRFQTQRFLPHDLWESAAVNVLHVFGLLPEWYTDDFTTALIVSVGSAPALERLRLLSLYPELVYCTHLLSEAGGQDQLWQLAARAEV